MEIILTPSTDAIVLYSTGDTTSWASIHDKTAGSAVENASASDIMIRRDGASNWVHTQRGFYLFDTSTLPSNAIITGGDITFTCQTKSLDNFSDSFVLVASTPASDSAIVAGDFDQYGTTRLATDIALSTITNGNPFTFNLNGQGISAINKEGISKFALLSKADCDNSQPVGTGDGRTQCSVYNSENATGKPTLTVRYTLTTGYSYLM